MLSPWTSRVQFESRPVRSNYSPSIAFSFAGYFVSSRLLVMCLFQNLDCSDCAQSLNGRADAMMRTLPHRKLPVQRSGSAPCSSLFATEVERQHAGLEPLRR
jgi:hypothetical protein